MTEAALYLILTLLPASFIQPFKTYAWIIGLLVPSTVLTHILALTIGASAFSEEYEMGTADFWLTRPMRRAEYFAGKVAGSLAFTGLIVLTYSVLSLLLSWWVFGPQSRLDLYAMAVLASVFSTLTFLSIGMATGELLRRSMLATIFAATTFFASLIIETYLEIVGTITGDRSLTAMRVYLPTWAASRLTATIVSSGLETQMPIPLPLMMMQSADIWTSTLNITLYSIAFLGLTLARFALTDVTRKAS